MRRAEGASLIGIGPHAATSLSTRRRPRRSASWCSTLERSWARWGRAWPPGAWWRKAWPGAPRRRRARAQRRGHQGPSGPRRGAGRRGRSAWSGRRACIGPSWARGRYQARVGGEGAKRRRGGAVQRRTISIRKLASQRRTMGRAGPWRASRAVILSALCLRPLRGAGRISAAIGAPRCHGVPAGRRRGAQADARSTRVAWPVLARAGHSIPVSGQGCASGLKPMAQREESESAPRGIHPARGLVAGHSGLRGAGAWPRVR